MSSIPRSRRSQRSSVAQPRATSPLVANNRQPRMMAAAPPADAAGQLARLPVAQQGSGLVGQPQLVNEPAGGGGRLRAQRQRARHRLRAIERVARTELLEEVAYVRESVRRGRPSLQ